MKRAICAVLAVLCVLCLSGCAATVPRQEYDALKEERDALRVRLTETLAEVEELQAMLKPSENASALDVADAVAGAEAAGNETVYVTESGGKYHIADCRYASGASAVTRAEAKEGGYEPCAVCNPG